MTGTARKSSVFESSNRSRLEATATTASVTGRGTISVRRARLLCTLSKIGDDGMSLTVSMLFPFTPVSSLTSSDKDFAVDSFLFVSTRELRLKER